MKFDKLYKKTLSGGRNLASSHRGKNTNYEHRIFMKSDIKIY